MPTSFSGASEHFCRLIAGSDENSLTFDGGFLLEQAYRCDLAAFFAVLATKSIDDRVKP